MQARDPACMAPAPGGVEAMVADVLSGLAGRFTDTGPKCWRLTGPGRRAARTTVRIADDWLVVERCVAGADLSRAARARRAGLRALAVQGDFPAGMRVVLPAYGLRLRWRGERPLPRPTSEETHGLTTWLRAALSAATTLASGAREACHAPAPPEAVADEAAQGLEVESICTEAGWHATPRTGSRDAVVELPARDESVCHAVISPAGTGLRLRVALTGDRATSPACQAAIAVALLRTAGSVRMVRATATVGEEGIEAALEVRLDAPPRTDDMNHALSALAVAHQQIADELDVLAGEDALARAYLRVQGVHATP